MCGDTSNIFECSQCLVDDIIPMSPNPCYNYQEQEKHYMSNWCALREY